MMQGIYIESAVLFFSFNWIWSSSPTFKGSAEVELKLLVYL